MPEERRLMRATDLATDLATVQASYRDAALRMDRMEAAIEAARRDFDERLKRLLEGCDLLMESQNRALGMIQVLTAKLDQQTENVNKLVHVAQMDRPDRPRHTHDPPDRHQGGTT